MEQNYATVSLCIEKATGSFEVIVARRVTMTTTSCVDLLAAKRG